MYGFKPVLPHWKEKKFEPQKTVCAQRSTRIFSDWHFMIAE
jgi:hypothetical protein